MRSNSRAAEAQARNGRVIVRLPRNWFDGKQTTFSLGLPENIDNLSHGNQIAAQINQDYRAGKFDRSLTKYRPQSIDVSPDYTIQKLWAKYCDYKLVAWKAKTINYNQVIIGRWIARLPPNWRNPLIVRSFLMGETTPGITARVLQSLSSCIDWAMRMGLVDAGHNPYQKMAGEVKTQKKSGGANALSVEEETRLIQDFYSSPVWQCYGHFVEFLFLSGCRPSEAVGLHWEQVAHDFSTIFFDRSVVQIGKEYQLNRLSKTNRSRIFPCSDRLQRLMAEIRSASFAPGPIFQLRGQYLSYSAFQYRAWKNLAMPILLRPSTPYSARDTFITRQIAAGKPIAVVAKWVDNSVKMIEGKYLDLRAIRTVRPD
jgi:integrase